MSGFLNLNKQMEIAADRPFTVETASHYGVEPLYNSIAPNFSPEDTVSYDRLGTLGRFGTYGGLQATFYVDNPKSRLEVRDEVIEVGLDLLGDHKTIVDAMTPDYKKQVIVEERLGSIDPRTVALIGGVTIFYDSGHDVFKHCLVYLRNQETLRHTIRRDILTTGPFNRGGHHSPIEKGIIHGSDSIMSSLGKGVAKHLLWQDPVSSSPQVS